MNSKQQDTLQLYMNYVLKAEISPLISQITNEIPRNLQDAIEKGQKKVKTINNTSEWQEQKNLWGKILERTNRQYGIMTPKARINLNHFYEQNNFIEVGHQPKYLGGERFVLNKLVCGGEMSNLFPKSVPLFYVADYDSVQNELTKTHFPTINSPSGLPMGINNNISSCFDGQCIECLPLPTVQDFTDMSNQIQSNYNFSINSCNFDNDKKLLLKERLESGILLLQRTYKQSQSYSDWFINILGEIGNLNSDYGYLFLRASDPEVKQLLLPHYENLLSKRKNYVQLYNFQFNEFQNSAIKPPLRKLAKDFIPFFYECSCSECHQRRIQLFMKEISNKMLVYGQCEACKEEIEFEININKPDLSDHINKLTPRVDTRQYLISKALKPAIHIAGTGETKYYMHTLPVMKKFDADLVLPIIYFYNKLTLNTFMCRNFEEKLRTEQFSEYFNYLKELMKPLGKFNKLNKKKDINTSEEIERHSEKITSSLLLQSEAFSRLETYLTTQLSTHLNPINENLVRSYLSVFMGKISQERSGQEAVFHWMDSVIHSGMKDIFLNYQRIYKPWIRPGLKLVL